MGNALVVQRTRLPQSSTSLRAAQYVRMSTDYQRYSIENQAAVIATYAKMHQLAIVRTYSDKGESGLKIKNRAGLIQLLDDVQSGVPILTISWSMTLADGDDSRTRMKARITSSSAKRLE
jgi:hypothetical protein